MHQLYLYIIIFIGIKSIESSSSNDILHTTPIHSTIHKSNPMHLNMAPYITIRSSSSMHTRGRKTNTITYRSTTRRRRKQIRFYIESLQQERGKISKTFVYQNQYDFFYHHQKKLY